MNNFSSINQRKKIPNPVLIGIKIAENYRNKWIYSDKLGSWLVYAYKQKGVWSIVSKEYIASESAKVSAPQTIDATPATIATSQRINIGISAYLNSITFSELLPINLLFL